MRGDDPYTMLDNLRLGYALPAYAGIAGMWQLPVGTRGHVEAVGT